MDTQPIQSPILLPRKKSLTWLIILVILLLLTSTGVLAYKYYQLKSLTAVVTPSPTPNQAISPELTAEQDATLDPTANWKIYINTAGYSIKYPESFTTQLTAAGSGRAEANSTTSSLFIYKSDSQEPYLERYINLDLFQDKPTYSQGTIIKEILDNRSVEKITIPNAPFDIYLAQLGTGKFIEIYVSNDPLRKEIIDQILSTFKFTN